MAVKTLKIAAAAAVAALAIALVWLVGAGEEPSERAAGGDSADERIAERESEAPADVRPREGRAEAEADPDEATADGQAEQGEEERGASAADDEERGTAPEPSSYREYEREDGAVVRDHREDADERPRGMGGVRDPRQAPETAENVETETVLAVREELRPSVHACRSEHAEDAEEGSAVQARITFSVSAEQLTVDDVATTSRGLSEPDDLEDCVDSAASELALDVPGAEDVEGHPIDLPFRIGPLS